MRYQPRGVIAPPARATRSRYGVGAHPSHSYGTPDDAGKNHLGGAAGGCHARPARRTRFPVYLTSLVQPPGAGLLARETAVRPNPLVGDMRDHRASLRSSALPVPALA